VFLAALAF